MWQRHAGICWPLNYCLSLYSSFKEVKWGVEQKVVAKQHYGHAFTETFKFLKPCPVSVRWIHVGWEMPFRFPTFSCSTSSQQCWSSPALHSLVTAYSQRSQAWDSGTAPRSGLGDGGVSQETEHKYQDPNNLITSGAIRSKICEAYPAVSVWRGSGDVSWGLDGPWRCLDSHHSYGSYSSAVGHAKIFAFLVRVQNFVFLFSPHRPLVGGIPFVILPGNRPQSLSLFISESLICLLFGYVLFAWLVTSLENVDLS